MQKAPTSLKCHDAIFLIIFSPWFTHVSLGSSHAQHAQLFFVTHKLLPLVYIICESVPSTYDVVKGVFYVTDSVLVIPVDATIPVFKVVSLFVNVVEFTNCVPFHRNISPTAIDEIDVSVNEL